MIRVIVADDNEIIQAYLKKILEETGKIEVCALASTGYEAVEITDRILPDVVLMDLQMEDDDAGINAIREIKIKHPEISVIVCTVFDDDDALYRAFGNGATNYVIKSEGTESLISAIYDAKNNVLNVNEKILQRLFLQIPRLYKQNQSILFVLNAVSKITKVDYTILKYIHEGKSYKEIADIRYVEEGSLRVQISRILRKFQVKTMKDLMKELEMMDFFNMYETILQFENKESEDK